MLAAPERSIDRGAADSEQIGELGGAVLAGGHQADQMGFLSRVELGLLAAQPALGLRDPHPFLGPQPDEVGLDYVDRALCASPRPPELAEGLRRDLAFCD